MIVYRTCGLISKYERFSGRLPKGKRVRIMFIRYKVKVMICFKVPSFKVGWYSYNMIPKTVGGLRYNMY